MVNNGTEEKGGMPIYSNIDEIRNYNASQTHEIELSQADMIKAIIKGVCEELKPVLLRLEERQNTGVLMGATAISNYMGVKLIHSIRRAKDRPEASYSVPQGSVTIKRWHKNWGFPANKTWKGTWFITRTLIDGWLIHMDMLARKLHELGYKVTSGGSKGGYLEYAHPFRYKEHEVRHAQAELAKDKAGRAM